MTQGDRAGCTAGITIRVSTVALIVPTTKGAARRMNSELAAIGLVEIHQHHHTDLHRHPA